MRMRPNLRELVFRDVPGVVPTASCLFGSAVFSLLIFLVAPGCCGSSPRFEHYGHFAQSAGDPVELEGYQFEGLLDHFQGSNPNNPLSIAREADGSVQLWIFQAEKIGSYELLTELKTKGGEYVCCMNCGTYDRSPSLACRPVDLIETPQKSEEIRLFEATLEPGVYCLFDKDARVGYIFNLEDSSNTSQSSEIAGGEPDGMPVEVPPSESNAADAMDAARAEQAAAAAAAAAAMAEFEAAAAAAAAAGNADIPPAPSPPASSGSGSSADSGRDSTNSESGSARSGGSKKSGNTGGGRGSSRSSGGGRRSGGGGAKPKK